MKQWKTRHLSLNNRITLTVTGSKGLRVNMKEYPEHFTNNVWLMRILQIERDSLRIQASAVSWLSIVLHLTSPDLVSCRPRLHLLLLFVHHAAHLSFYFDALTWIRWFPSTYFLESSMDKEETSLLVVLLLHLCPTSLTLLLPSTSLTTLLSPLWVNSREWKMSK